MQRKNKSLLDHLKANTNYLFLMILWLFHLINNYIWLKIDTSPLRWDPGNHYLSSLRYFDVLSHPSIHLLSEIVNVCGTYPPLVGIIPTPLYVLFGRDPDTAIFIMNSIFLFILIFSVYGIGKKLCNNNAGILASFIVIMYPMLFGQTRLFMPDLPLTAMTSLSLYTLLLTDGFKNRKYSLFFGMTLGLGMLTKFTFVFYVIGPIAFVMYPTFKFNINTILKKEEFVQYFIRSKIQFFNVISSLFLGGLVLSVWYLPNFHHVLKSQLANATAGGAIRGHPDIFTLKSFLYYLFGLINDQSFFFFVLFIIALLYLTKLKSKNITFLAIWIGVTYLVFSLILNKDIRYIMPLLPAVALISAIGIERINNRKVKTVLIALIIIFGCVQFFAVSYGTDHLPQREYIITSLGTINLFNQNLGFAPHPIAEDWKTQEILEIINETRTYDTAIIGVIPDNPSIHTPIRYYSYLYNLPFSITANGGYDPYVALKSDYVLTLKDEKGNMGPWFLMNNINNATKLFKQNINNFTLIKTIQLPDKSELLIYKLKNISLLGESRHPDTSWVAITNIMPDKTSYKPNENMTVEITLKNMDKIKHNASAWWFLDPPGGESPWKESVIASKHVQIYLDPEEEKTILLTSKVPDRPGTYDLSAWVHVRIDDKGKHSDGAWCINKIDIIDVGGCPQLIINTDT